MSVYNKFPDDSSDKEIFFQVFGSVPEPLPPAPLLRHVALYWKNGVTPQKELVTQLIHLTGYWAHYSPMVIPYSDKKFNFSLGSYTRAQRDTILQLLYYYDRKFSHPSS